MKHARTSSARSAFTLVELMVVIGIITLLAGLLVVALNGIGVKARQEATRATIQKVSKQIEERMDALDRLRSQPQWAKDVKTLNATLGFAPDDIHWDHSKVLLFKNRMKLAFPQSFAEFASFDVPESNKLTAPDYATWLGAHSMHNTETESSALLYYILTSGKNLGIPTVDPSEYKASEVQDTDGDGLMEFVDAWGKPLRFYRWPTRLFTAGAFDYDNSVPAAPKPIRSQIDRTRGSSVLYKGLAPAASPDPLSRDADDPTSKLLLFNQNDAENFERNYHTPFTYHQFLIVSSGPDGQKTASPNEAFGLLPPSDQYASPNTLSSPLNYGYLAQPILTPAGLNAMTDNITNRNP